nr:MAG TPA: hypothetical protein [Caudoviricetes sp.]
MVFLNIYRKRRFPVGTEQRSTGSCWRGDAGNS